MDEEARPVTAPLDPDFVAAEPPLPLFDLPPVEPAEPVEELSYDRRLTIRRKELLSKGTHPRTRLALADNGETCGTCRHHGLQGGTAGTYHKCDWSPFGTSYITGGPATDVRVGWPACTAWGAESE